jgi:hypothetical protein
MMDRKQIADDLRSTIIYYAELVAHEDKTQDSAPEVEKTWDDITNLINALAKGK